MTIIAKCNIGIVLKKSNYCQIQNIFQKFQALNATTEPFLFLFLSIINSEVTTLPFEKRSRNDR